MMNKDLKKIEKALVAQGFTTRLSTKGHLLVRKNGVSVAVFSGTPSDIRAWRNSLADCRRAGFIWPPPR